MQEESTGMLDFSMTTGSFWCFVTVLLYASLNHYY